MSSYEVRFTREAQKDFAKLTPKLRERLREILVNTIVIIHRTRTHYGE